MRWITAHPEFVKAFVSECFSRGFNEKQASELLTEYSKAEFYNSDKDFREGVDTFFKEGSTVPKATWQLIKALGKSIKGKSGLSTPVLTGAAAGAIAPEGMLPDDFEGGALSGATLGALLGALGTRGRGLGSSLNRIGKSVSKGGVGRTAIGEAGRLLTNKSILKGTGRGLLGGLAARHCATPQHITGWRARSNPASRADDRLTTKPPTGPRTYSGEAHMQQTSRPFGRFSTTQRLQAVQARCVVLRLPGTCVSPHAVAFGAVR
jgi:hypothetical protein